MSDYVQGHTIFIVHQELRQLRALCVGRHEFVSEHIARFFGEFGLLTESVVGEADAAAAAARYAPDLILCEYELLTSFPLATWERDERLANTSIIGVSLSRRPDEAYPLDVNGIAGFLYLPTLNKENALRVINAAAASTRAHYTPAPLSTSTRAITQTKASTR